MKTLGIDLGTTNSCVYYLDDERQPVLVEDRLRRKIFPSVVYCAGPEQPVIVGHRAKSRMGQNPLPLIAVKRKMGTTEELLLGGRPVPPIEVSAHILRYARELVETVTGDRVGAAVVTVPAYFDSAPRKDTHEAAVRALFDGDAEAARGRLELQLEPEAAAFAYTLEDEAERLRLLVYDLGGGTFDVTVLDKAPDSGLTELKFGGDPHLGGENFDDRIASWLLYLLRGGNPEALERIFGDERYPRAERTSILLQLLANDTTTLDRTLRPEDRDLLIGHRPRHRLDLDPGRAEDLARIQKLKLFAEKAKKDLTVATEASLCEQGAFTDHDGELVDIELHLSRADFDLLIGDLVARTLEETRRVLDASHTSRNQVDRVLLVGGSTRMPIVAEKLGEIFDCPILSKDPDLIVARGAALRARDLGVVIEDAAGERRLELEFPRETPFPRINIKGRLDQSRPGYRVNLSREDGEELCEVEVEDDRFLLSDIALEPGKQNIFLLEVSSPEDDPYAEAELSIRHDPRAVASAGGITTKITKSFQSQGVRGFEILFAEGTALPLQGTFRCFRASNDNFISIPFFEGERHLDDLVIPDLDPGLAVGAEIQVRITIEKDYTVQTTATIVSTGQTRSLQFTIRSLETPSLETLDQECQDLLEQTHNDLELVRDPNVRARMGLKCRKLDREYHKARRALEIDPHKLLATVGELRKALVEVRGAQAFLAPPYEVFERALGECHSLAGRLPADGSLTSAAARERVELAKRTGEEAWEAEDADTWRRVNGELERLRDDLEKALTPPPPAIESIPPQRIQSDLLGWIAELRGRLAAAEIEDRFDRPLSEVAAAVRGVDLTSAESARQDLMHIAQTRLHPLDQQVEQAIDKLLGSTPKAPAQGGKGWVEWSR